jgi:hypothetical protein
VGLLGAIGAVIFALLGWGRLRFSEGALDVIARGPFARWMAGRAWAAFTLSWVIWYWTEASAADPRVRRHEREHVRQCLWFGPLVLLTYPSGSLYAVLKGGHPYCDNPFEEAARRAAGQ